MLGGTSLPCYKLRKSYLSDIYQGNFFIPILFLINVNSIIYYARHTIYRKEENNDLTFFELRRDVKCFFSFNEKKHLILREEIAMQMFRPKNVCVYIGYIHTFYTTITCTYNNADGTHIESDRIESLFISLASTCTYCCIFL
jgi:hypothetical protein